MQKGAIAAVWTNRTEQALHYVPPLDSWFRFVRFNTIENVYRSAGWTEIVVSNASPTRST